MWLGLYGVMQAHPNAIPLIAKGGSYSSSAGGGTFAMARILRDAGLTPEEAAQQLHVLAACVVGFGFATLWGSQVVRGEVSPEPAGEPGPPPPPELRPYLERMGRWESGEFDRALDIVLGTGGPCEDSGAPVV